MADQHRIVSSERKLTAEALPAGSQPIAVLCVGHTDEFYDEPMLQKEHWARRGALQGYVMENRWDEQFD